MASTSIQSASNSLPVEINIENDANDRRNNNRSNRKRSLHDSDYVKSINSMVGKGMMETRKLRDLQLNQMYEINEIRLLSTRYGSSVVAHLYSPVEKVHFKSFLPSRMKQLFPDQDAVAKFMREVSGICILELNGNTSVNIEFVSSSVSMQNNTEEERSMSGYAQGLRLTELKMEKHTVRGNGTLLECKFDLEGETLYAVKWYKDGNEFYRYVPKEQPQIQVFDVAGVHVDVKNSGASRVYLKKLELSSSGRYRCEVSGEAPSFTTVTEHNDMITVALPDDGPKISGGKPRYHVGEQVNVNCTSGTSKPAAILQWYINGEQVNSSFLRGPYKKIVGRESLETTILGLTFKVQQHHFRGGDMKLKCLATISSVYWKSNEESVEGEKQSKPPVLEIKRTDDADDDKSRADRVQASTGCRRCNCYILINLLTLHVIVVAVVAVR